VKSLSTLGPDDDNRNLKMVYLNCHKLSSTCGN
jgi:hypothetical protein